MNQTLGELQVAVSERADDPWHPLISPKTSQNSNTGSQISLGVYGTSRTCSRYSIPTQAVLRTLDDKQRPREVSNS